MQIMICRYYYGLPDVRTLAPADVRLFYDWIRAELKEATKTK